MKEVNWRCNDCERGFANKKAWEYHGAQSGHNIDSTLPGKQDREVAELRQKLKKYETAYKLVNEERAKLATKISAIVNVLNL